MDLRSDPAATWKTKQVRQLAQMYKSGFIYLYSILPFTVRHSVNVGRYWNFPNSTEFISILPIAGNRSMAVGISGH